MTSRARGGVAEIACQQVLLQDGTVFSVQWLVVPARYAHALTAGLLLERYLKLVRDYTFSLVRPVSGPDGIQFRLVGTSLALLSFAPPEFQSDPHLKAVQLHTVGGLLVRKGDPGRGMLSFLIEQEEGGVRVTLQLFYSRPLLLGSGRPSRLRRILFRISQGRFHKAITLRFLGDLYRDLTGERSRLQLRNVRVKQGKDI